jgi:hypothetical protein
MPILALLLLLVASPAFAQDSLLTGNWKLVSFQNILEVDPFVRTTGTDFLIGNAAVPIS